VIADPVLMIGKRGQDGGAQDEVDIKNFENKLSNVIDFFSFGQPAFRKKEETRKY